LPRSGCPISPADKTWSDVGEWVDESYPVVVNAEGEAWARDNAASIKAKQDKYLRVWLQKPERPTLRPADGVPGL